MEKLEQQGVDCQPKASTIRIIQDKYIQKVHFSPHGIPLPEFMEVNDLESARRAGKQFGYPLMVKSKSLAYDGRGNAVAKSEEELSSAITALGGFDRSLYIEKWAPFVKVEHLGLRNRIRGNKVAYQQELDNQVNEKCVQLQQENTYLLPKHK
ncbi:phosphoribosylaminoimidazole carboxylase, chloroplastic-like isoform X2 [Citrus sinensis]|uniref:phosphoribosylaminoimidazole carboxylase, chloroplastic-like isoform X2 n=1 Tax=Citrus sinensis TaxID=2711 RepID=UPI0022792B9E|nr:phosphoribosylaminoimidazole carboxylase, chloroplastic-like isoform X2 [Citrus sinensis]